MRLFFVAFCSFFFLQANIYAQQKIPLQGVFLTRDGVRIYYNIQGSGPETVVVSGGFLTEEGLKPLAQARRVIFYDARGRGRSDSVKGVQVGLDHQVNDLEDLRKFMRLEKMTLLGWSGMGKEFAVYTVRYPNRVTRLIQVAPVPPVAKDYMERMMNDRMKKVDEKALAELRTKREAGTWKNDPEGYCRAEAKVLELTTFFDPTKAKAQPDVCKYPNEWPANLGAYFETLIPSVEGVNLLPELKNLNVKRLVIHGAEDSIPLEGARDWVTSLPNVCLFVIPQAGHWPFLEQPEKFFDAVNVFLSGQWPKGAQGQNCS
jgi:proline iminopeptidase